MLKIEHLTKTYRGASRPAVDDLSLEVASGEIFAFIGHNGAGKTTTIKAVVGALAYDGGEITIDGHDLAQEPLACKSILAYIPDNPDLYDHLTGWQYLRFVADIYRVDAETRRRRIEQYAKELEIYDRLAELIGGYSHGMKQKLAFVAAFLHEPKLLVLDEPFVGLDPKAAFTVKQMMHELCGRGGAIFFSTHVLDVAEKLCDRVAIIKEGRLLCAGGMHEILHDRSLEDVFLELVDE